MHRLIRQVRPTTLALVLVAAIAGGGVGIAASSGDGIHGCVEVHKRILLVKQLCTLGQTGLVFGAKGPQGARGQRGLQGPPGSAIWERVEAGQPGGGADYKPAATHTPAGVTIGGEHFGVGLYSVGVRGANPPSLAQCSWSATAEGRAPDPAETIATTALNGSAITVGLFDKSGTPIDAGFTFSIHCP